MLDPKRRLKTGERYSFMREDRWRDAMVLLALYGLADEEGLFCHASNDEIAEKAGLSGVGHTTIGRRISFLASQQHIYVIKGRRRGNPKRVIILADHPEAEDALAGYGEDLLEAVRDQRRYRPDLFAESQLSIA